MTRALLDDAIKANDVAAYLRRHPGFLCDYPEIAMLLTLPREQDTVASLAAYQLHALRAKTCELERKLTELTSIAAENERLMQRMHEFNVAVLRAPTPEAASRSVVARLSEDFGTDQTRLILFGKPALPPADWLLPIPEGRAAMPQFEDFWAVNEPIAGRLCAERLKLLFGAHASKIKSAALVPLGGKGALALGSEDANRFQPGMGTLFLKMISATITTALDRIEDDA